MTSWFDRLIARNFHWIFAFFVVSMLAYAVALMPVAFGDQFDEIVRTYRFTFFEILEFLLADAHVYFRPLEYFWRKFLFFVFGEQLFSYNLFGIVQLIVIAGLFAGICWAKSSRDALAAAIALSCLLGHHAYAAIMELNHVISGMVIVVALLLSMLVLESRGRAAAAIGAVLLSFVALTTKEIGIVVPFVLFLGWLLGFRGVKTSTAITVGLLCTIYLGFRIYVVIMLGEIDNPGYGEDVKGYAVYFNNVIATLLNIIMAEPKMGRLGEFLSALGSAPTTPWKLAQIAAPLTSFVLIGYVGFSRRIWRKEADLRLRRWLILLGGVLTVSTMLGFYHSADYFGATTLPVLAIVLYLSMREVMRDVEDEGLARGLRACLVCLLVVVSTSWTLRVAGSFFFVRDLGAGVQEEWILRYDEFRVFKAGDGVEIYLQQFRNAAIGTPVASVDEDDRLVRAFFGYRGSIGR